MVVAVVAAVLAAAVSVLLLLRVLPVLPHDLVLPAVSLVDYLPASELDLQSLSWAQLRVFGKVLEHLL